MINEDDFLDAASESDPDYAFVRLETRFRDVLEAKIEASDSNYSYGVAVSEYMNHTLAAARYFELGFLEHFTVPNPSDDSNVDLFQRFTTAIDAFKVRVRLEHARSLKKFSVGLSETDKEKIRFYVDQIKSIIDSAGLREEKRDSLYDKINSFLKEIDRNRAPWNRFGDIVIYVASVGGEAAEKLEPARKWIDSIAALLGNNKEIENSQPRLPNERRKQIEDRRSKRPVPSDSRKKPHNDTDEEIPF